MEYKAGSKTSSGYLALPSGGTGPVVLVLHAWWGLNDFFVHLCDRLAQQGFVALAPDLNEGKIASSIEEAKQIMKSRDFEATRSRVLQALDTLRQHPAALGQQTGVLGFSMGAAWALQLSTLKPEEVSAVVLFYGLDSVDFTAARAAYLGHFAEKDTWEPLEQVRQMEVDMRAAGREVTFYIYPEAGHWFFENNQPEAFHAESARQAWERTISFLHNQLESTP